MRVQQLITVFVQNLHDIQWYHTSRWISSIKKIPSWWDVLRIWHGYIITQHLMHSTAFLLLMDWHPCVCVCLSVSLYVGHDREPCKYCWTAQSAIQVAEFRRPKESHKLHIVGVHIGDFWRIRWIDLCSVGDVACHYHYCCYFFVYWF